MSITYTLSKNNLMNGANQYRAVVQSMDTANLEQVVDRMVAYGCAVSRTDALSVLQHYFAMVETMLLEGYRIVTPGVNYSISIKGNFDGKTDSFSAERHSIEAIVSPGARLRRAIRERAHAQKELAVQARPELLEYIDWNSGRRDSSLTPGGLGQIVGQRLKFDPAQPEQGIFFVAAGGKTYQAGVISKNTSAELTFLVPTTLPPGDYTLEVRAALSQGPLRSGSLEATLTVN